MNQHAKQIEAFNDPTRFKFVLAGRRSGKTFMELESICRSLHTCPPGGEIFYIGPTNRDAIDLIWEGLEDRLDQLGWDYDPKVSKQRFDLSRRRKVFVIGAEKIRRIRGHSVWACYMDEVAFFGDDLFNVWRAVRPALSDLKGHAMLATTPNGKNTPAYDFYLKTLESPDWSYHHWHTLDSPFIDRDEIEAARIELDEKSFAQEYLAQWITFEGLAYYCFDESTHIKECSKFNNSMPTGICLDFNVNPTSLLVTQRHGGHTWVRKEYSLKNSSTVQTVRSFCEDFKSHKGVIEIYGDSTGKSRRSNTGFSDYHYIEEILREKGFQYQIKVPSSNPAIVDRVAHLNAHLRNAKGESRLTIDPSCKDTIRDLGSQVLEGRFPSDKNNLGHKGDALGYYVNWLHITENTRPSRMIQL